MVSFSHLTMSLFRSFFVFLLILLVLGTSLELYQLYLKNNTAGEAIENNGTKKFLLGFSVYSNSMKLLNTNIPKGADHLGCIDGIRFLSMSWVVLCHCWGEAFTMPMWDRTFSIVKTASDSFWMNPLLNGFPSVDSFFLISGVLLSYLTLKELEKTKGRVNIGLFYAHRYLRLTGTYLIIIGFHSSLIRHLCFGPKCASLQFFSDGCQKSWWRNILYINNFGDGNGENFADVRTFSVLIF